MQDSRHGSALRSAPPVLRARAPLVGALALALLSTTPSSQAVRLNGPLAHPGANDVTGLAVSTDGTWVAYRADQDTDEVFEPYAAPSDGSAPGARISAPLVANGDVLAFAVGATRAAYVADQDADERYEVFSAPLDGSAAPLKLSLPLPPLASAGLAWIAPDGRTALFAVHEPFAGLTRLYRAPLDGSASAVEIADSGAPVPVFFGSTFFVDLAFTVDGQHAVYRTQTFDDEHEPTVLRQVRVDGSQAPVDLSVPSDSSHVREDYALSRDGSRVAYVEGIGTQNRLFAVAIDGTQRAQLNPTGTLVTEFAMAPDGARVVYVQTDRLGQNGDLYSSASDGTQRVQLDPPGTAASGPRITPDGARVVFVAGGNLYATPLGGAPSPTFLAGPGATADFGISADSTTIAAVVVDGSSFRGLYAVPAAGGASPALLNGPPRSGRGVASTGQKLGLAGARVVYRQDRATDEALELYSAPLDASAPEVRISAALGQARDVQSFELFPGGLAAVYRADQTNDETYEAFATPLDGSSGPRRLNLPFASGPVRGDVVAFLPAADDARVVFRADQDSDEVFELFTTRVLGRGTPRPLSGSFTVFDDVLEGFARSDEGGYVAYQRDTLGGPFVLFGTRSDGSGSPLALDQDPYEFPGPFAFTPDETRVVYRKELFFGSRYGLFSARLDGALPPVHLNPGAIAESSVASDLRLAPGGERVVYRADQDVDGRPELFSVPSDGSAPPLRLNAPLAAGARVHDFRIGPDGRRVFFRAGPLAAQLELFGVPVDGGTPVRLHPPLASDRGVTDYAVTADGRRVVYRADQEIDQQNELFSVPSSGHHPPLRGAGGEARVGSVRLTPLASGEDVQSDFALDPGGRRVVYRAGALTTRFELFQVPIDGSAPPLRLSGPLVASGNVTGFAASPDGTRVVYRADQRVNELHELFSVPSGGGPGVALDPLPAFADVDSFRIAPDSLHVVYRADRGADEVFELFAVPLDGSAPPRRLNDPLAPGGDVQADYVALPGGRALFRADQEADDVFELFIGFYDRGPLPYPPP
jgi:Tol biopolymer transport system component